MADRWILLAEAFDLILQLEEDEELADRKLSRALWGGQIKAIARTAIVDDAEEQKDVPLPTIIKWHGWPEDGPITYYWKTSRAKSPHGFRRLSRDTASVKYAPTMYYVVKVSLDDILLMWVDADISKFLQDTKLPPARSGAAGRPSSITYVEEELDRRIALGEVHKNNTTWSNILHSWFKETHPYEPNITPKTIRNNPSLSKKMKAARPPEAPEKS